MNVNAQPQSPDPDQTKTPWRLLVLLMAMTAIGPAALNIIVPAIPGLAAAMASDANTVQLAVSLFILGLAFAQLVLGPLSDRLGRRPVVLGGLAVMIAASLAALATRSAPALILARIAQALGASTGIVIGRAILRDLFERERAASMLGLVATAMVVAPMIGPLVGGVLDTLFGWESIFIFMAATGFLVLVWAALALPETKPSSGGRSSFLHDSRVLLTSPVFHGYVLCGAFASGTSSPFSAAGRMSR
jgi:DHA1 family bicyclomycin/chloramphenicol resistance-like MFS transporter